MTVKTAHLELYQGDDEAWTVTVRDASGELLDLTGITPRAQIRRQVADKDPVVVYEIPITIESAGTMVMNVPRTASAALSGKYVWDFQLTGDGRTTILAGNVSITQEVTRDESAIRASSTVIGTGIRSHADAAPVA